MTTDTACPRRPARLDRWRLGARATWARRPLQEWHHFIVFLADGALLINFSREVQPDGAEFGRVIVLHHGDGWTHELVSRSDAWFARDGLHTRIAANRLDIADDGWRLSVATADGRIDAALSFAPATPPLVARNRSLGDGGHLHWIMYPAATADGHVHLGGETRELRGATAYHDHNWGEFAWGDDFGWEWGILAAAGDRRATLVCSALTDRTRSLTHIQQMFFWIDGAHAWTARGPEIQRRAEGRWPTLRVPRLPAVLSVATPPSTSVPPRELVFTAEDGPRRADVHVTLNARAQVLIPDDHAPLSAVVLNECVGTAQVRWSLAGHVQHEATHDCVFEVLEGGGRAR